MEQWNKALHDWMTRQVQRAEANDPELRGLKDAVNAASRRSDEAAAKSEDGLVPMREQSELDAAIWALIRHIEAR